MSCDHTQQSGFTLIEVVVALLITSLALAVIYESLGWSLRRSAALRQREHAWLAAQSLLSELRHQPQLQAGSNNGVTEQGLKWLVQVRERPAPASRQSNQPQLSAFDVTVQVRWGQRAAQQVRLRSIEVPGMLP